MKVLALEPYYGGSHKAFLDGWIENSRHEWSLITLPPYKWKWRMRHAAVTLAEKVQYLKKENWDILFATDMMNLAEFRGLTCKSIAQLPTVFYFHENQLSYPVIEKKERDMHFGYTNFTSALSAERIWFNTEYHRKSFISSLRVFLQSMPDYNHTEMIDMILKKSEVHPQGFYPIGTAKKNNPLPHIVWAARWDYDKNPELFFKAIEEIKKSGRDFKISVIGEQFQNSPEIFEKAKSIFKDNIVNWGYLNDRSDYERCLQSADIFVSTAIHEFFGVAAVEAISAGAYPLLPERLAYPEILALKEQSGNDIFFYDGTLENLIFKLKNLLLQFQTRKIDNNILSPIQKSIRRFSWENLAPILDKNLFKI